MQQPISILAFSSISPLGENEKDIWESYLKPEHALSLRTFSKSKAYCGALPVEIEKEIEALRLSDLKYKSLDKSVLFAIYTARKCAAKAGWSTETEFGINIGSSRGATGLFESYHKDFLKRDKAKTLSSPTTTLGNISSWVAHDLGSTGPEISHSVTCSTALHALLNGIAWLSGGLSDKFMVGGTEAPLTAFTVAQMKALKIYSNHETETQFPCRSLDETKTKNTMVLGEGAAMTALKLGKSKNALAHIIGFGYATELLEHNASLSANANCLQKSMKMAIKAISPDDVDVIITHTPGTKKGDQSEINAIHSVFCNKIPALTTNKWKIGHSLGASGLFNIEMAMLMLKNQDFINTPFINQNPPAQIKTVLVNAVGFGGNAVSILLSN
ncbi:MAG: beta-ketoacyl synthase [Bacteroidetes bacterium MedPE-SWsnd-G2]|nr:MAG: beta-ketoacyl synthase [Bacteroidetes bacterium MedPE-SWsnd-G2]